MQQTPPINTQTVAGKNAYVDITAHRLDVRNNLDKKYDTCWLCGGKQIVDLYVVNGFTVSKCKDCTLRFIREILDDEHIKDYYTQTANEVEMLQVYRSAANENKLKYAHKAVANRIKKQFGAKDNLKLLDLGCSTGLFFDFFPGWDVYGVEIEESAGNIAKAKYNNVFIGDMKDAGFKDNFFDCITISDALDHFNNPLEVIKRCHGLLKKNGIITIKVHNIDCLLSKITGKKFYAIIPPEHLTYFNLRTLKLLLSNNGFEYSEHFYNTQKLRLDNAVMRASTTFSFLSPVHKLLSRTVLGGIPLYKNFHDLITVIGKKP